MKDGPLKSAFETSTEGVLYQELRFSHDGNYHDTTHQLPLVQTNE